MKYINDNIYNLTHLWATVSKPFNGYTNDNALNYVQIKTSEWPNRIWINKTLNSKTLISVKELIKNSQNNMLFVDFECEEQNHNYKLIENNGLKLSSSLPGMSLKLSKRYDNKTPLKFTLVTNAIEAKLWCDIFKQSFGYIISEELVITSLDTVNYYIAFNNNIPVGTIKLFQTNKTAGIYSLGVPPNMRGNGYAKDIMSFILNKSIQQGATLATLQASRFAETLYQKLGFQKDFTMHSYKLNT